MTYLNSEVFYHKLPADSCELFPMPPRDMAIAVGKRNLSAGPLPIAAVMNLREDVRPLGDLGVSCDGPALRVFLFANKPVHKLTGRKIAITSHTMTSVQLLRILLKDLWDVSDYEFVETDAPHEAALWIGDPALNMVREGQNTYAYDLGEAWKRLT